VNVPLEDQKLEELPVLTTATSKSDEN